MKFKGIIEHLTFKKLTPDEQKEYLIYNKIFVLTNEIDEYDEIEIYGRTLHEDLKILSSTIITEKGNFTLNYSILEELRKSIVEQCEEIHKVNTKRYEILKKQFKLYSKEKVAEEENSAKLSIATNLDQKLFRELLNYDIDDISSHKKIILKYIKYDFNLIHSYLQGISENSSFTKNIYQSFLYQNIILNVISEINTNDNIISIKNTIPKRIALLESLEIFEKSKLAKYNQLDQYKIIAYLFGLEPHKNNLDIIRRNIAVLNPDSQEDPHKYTSHKHVDKIIKELLN